MNLLAENMPYIYNTPYKYKKNHKKNENEQKIIVTSFLSSKFEI